MIDHEELKKIELFEDLNEEELKKVADICEEEQHKAGDILFSENSPADNLYVMRRGRVAIEIEVSGGKKVNVYTASQDDEPFGWSALVEPFKSTASARCVKDSTIVSIDGRGLKNLIDNDYRLGYIIMRKVARVISTRLRNTRLQLISVAYG
ncbi:MAG: cyclic nucleotide-binding domain-containing protein [Thermodesulfobacteriota bacterium]